MWWLVIITVPPTSKHHTSKESAVRACDGEEGLLPLICQLYVHVLVRKAYCL